VAVALRRRAGRVIDAQITVATSAGRTAGAYRLITTLRDPGVYPAGDIVTLYHQRWDIEGLNGYAKDTAHQALAQPARRRVRGIAAQSIFTALLLIAANIRKIRAWRALASADKARIVRRARRRRPSLRDYLPDG
jgi:hypothetical protein